jgi:hypothetical protein
MNSIGLALITVSLGQLPLSDPFQTTIYGGLASSDLTKSMSVVAYLELGAEPQANAKDVKEFMTKCGAKLFVSEIAKFRKKMRAEKFGTLTLAVVFLDMQTESPGTWKTKEHPQGTRLLSILVRPPTDRAAAAPDMEADVRGVQCFARNSRKNDKVKRPVTAHCSFVFLAHNDTRAALKTLSFDIYLEELSPHEGTILTYPWKVENVQYK